MMPRGVRWSLWFAVIDAAAVAGFIGVAYARAALHRRHVV